jgi:hypothetical protein
VTLRSQGSRCHLLGGAGSRAATESCFPFTARVNNTAAISVSTYLTSCAKQFAPAAAVIQLTPSCS